MAVEDSDSFDLKRLPEGMPNPFRDIKCAHLIWWGTRGGWGIPSEHKCRAVLTSVHTSAHTIRGTRVEAASRCTMVSRRGLVNDRDLLGSIRSLTIKREQCYIGKDQSYLKRTYDAEEEEERFFCPCTALVVKDKRLNNCSDMYCYYPTVANSYFCFLF